MREVGGGIGMGNTCKPMAVSFQCMTKSTTNKKIKKNKNKKSSVLGGEDLLEKEMAIHSSILAWEIHGQRNLAHGPWDHKSLTQLSD